MRERGRVETMTKRETRARDDEVGVASGGREDRAFEDEEREEGLDPDRRFGAASFADEGEGMTDDDDCVDGIGSDSGSTGCNL